MTAFNCELLPKRYVELRFGHAHESAQNGEEALGKLSADTDLAPTGRIYAGRLNGTTGSVGFGSTRSTTKAGNRGLRR